MIYHVHTDMRQISWAAWFESYLVVNLQRQVFSWCSTLIAAINDACLVYDGKLVIDAYFHTNDASIRAAGPLTKFQRKYHAEKWTHSNFNSKEVGVHVSYYVCQSEFKLEC